MKEKGIGILLILLVLFGGGILIFLGYTANKKVVVYIEENPEKDEYKENDFYMEFARSESWEAEEEQEGAQYDGIFYNFGEKELTDWEVVIEFPKGSRLDSCWNGVYKLEDGSLTVTGVDYNEIIRKKSSIPIGFIMYTPKGFEINDIKITAHQKVEATDYVLFKILILGFMVDIWFLSSCILAGAEARALKKKEEKQKEIIVQSLKTFANIIDAKDSYTKGHSLRVSDYSQEIAKRMGMGKEECEKVRYIALLHDIGKIGVPEEILKKPGKLNGEEWERIRAHVVIGGEILKDFTAIEDIAEGARYHHERYDGKGYVMGRTGKEIPLCARIICVADSYDAMASKRCYRSSMNEEEIIKELREGSGAQFDPDIVKYMIEMIEDGFVYQYQKNPDE